jgi:hypothetical protein
MQPKVKLKTAHKDLPAGAEGYVIGEGEESGVMVHSISPYGGGEWDEEWSITHYEIDFGQHGIHWLDDSDVEWVLEHGKKLGREGNVRDYNVPEPKKPEPKHEYKDGEIPF